ncbi:MAG: hypothetical protein ING50_01015 [Burkholderiales bacterium]|nr:hypothetical protein [Burkholderiales bacterium]
MQHLLPGAGAEGHAVRDGRRRQRPQHARLLAVGVQLGQPGLARVVHPHALAREGLHRLGDDGLQQRVRRLVAGRLHRDEHRHAIVAAWVHAIQDRAIPVDDEVGGRAKVLDRRDGAAVAFVGLQAGSVEQMPCEHAPHHLCSTGVTRSGCAASSRRSGIGRDSTHCRTATCGMTRSTRCAAVCDMRRAPQKGQQPPAFAAEGKELVVAAIAAAQPEEAVSQNAAIEIGVELALQAAHGQWPGPSQGTSGPLDCLCPGSALMNRGNSDPVLDSVWAMKPAAWCCTRRYSVVCSGRRRA